MNRRNFLKLSGITGTLLLVPIEDLDIITDLMV